MHLVAVILILIIWGAAGLKDALKPRATHMPTSEELDQMTLEMVGKSQKECRKIADKYFYKKDGE